jgi:hypothetical protein
MVYVQNIKGEPLMPTTNPKARVLLKNKKAKVVEVYPFTIRLTYETTNYVQYLVLGEDTGYANIGLSVISDTKEILSATVKLVEKLKERNEERLMYRKNRRQRLRYRKQRSNRNIPDGWYAPSIEHKLDSHIKITKYITTLLPIKVINLELGHFDIQEMMDSEISGDEYQKGKQYGYYNVKEYVKFRDGHKCQNPNCPDHKKKTETKPVLHVHHIKYRSMGGTDAPDNLITLCAKCHSQKNHKEGGFLYEWAIAGKEVRGFRDAIFMNYLESYVLPKMQEEFPNIQINTTKGYITKVDREELGITKTHNNDAFVIAGGRLQQRAEHVYEISQMRKNNRSLELFYDAQYTDIRTGEKASGKTLSSGRTGRNTHIAYDNQKIYRGAKISKGRRSIRKNKYQYQPKDVVKFSGKLYNVKGSHNYGTRVILENGKSISVKQLKIFKYRNSFVWN